MYKNQETTEMNHLFRQVASFCGLRLSYYVTVAFITLVFFLLILTEYRTMSPLYLILTALVLPGILRAMLFPDTKQKKKRENVSTFPLFCKKYRYSTQTHTSLNLAYLLLFLMIFAWRVSYIGASAPMLLTKLPILTGVFSLVLRTFTTLGYLIYFRCFPLRAMR